MTPIQAGTDGELLVRFGLQQAGSVPWGTRPGTGQPGVYVVSMTRPLATAPFDLEAIEGWLVSRPELVVRGSRPAASVLADHLARWWLPTEVVLYIGKATSLAARVGQYYDTKLGEGGPHAGGAWLKTLGNLSELTVSWALTASPGPIEAALLTNFGAAVVPHNQYPDRDLVLPWANLEAVVTGRRRRRQHELYGARPTRPQRPTRANP